MELFFNMAFSHDIDNSEKLFYRSETFFTENDTLVTNSAGEVSFDTFFNIIPVDKIILYTDIRKLFFDIDASGGYSCSIWHNDGKKNRMISDNSSVCIDDLKEKTGFIYLKINAESKLVVRRISVLCESETSRNINLCVVMCTYKREDFAVRNANYIAEKGHFDVIVVDNGKTLSKEMLTSDSICLVHNENTGGSGGFGKGMATVAEKNRYSHFILMDDDVNISINSLEKAVGFLKFTKKEYEDICISGTMFFLDAPCISYESGGKFHSDGVQKGYNFLTDASESEGLLDLEQPKDINYGGWWLMCMPVKYAEEGNRPLPFFIKYDDVEFALRCKLSIITISGFCVWHERFENKYNSAVEYYNSRNYLHLRKITDKSFSKKQARKITLIRVIAKCCRQQYDMARAVILGYKDFLKGLDYLYEIDGAKNNQKISSLNYKMLSEKELQEIHNVSYHEEKEKQAVNAKDNLLKKLTLYGHLLPPFLRSDDYAITDPFFDKKEMYFRKKKALHFNKYTRTGYVTKASFISFVKCLIFKTE